MFFFVVNYTYLFNREVVDKLTCPTFVKDFLHHTEGRLTPSELMCL